MAEGILLVDKPAGYTSFDIIAQTRKRFGVKKVGHTGTLDPFATGLLVVLIGRKYTRLAQTLSAEDKSYEALICLGTATDTDDCEGQVIAQADASHLKPNQIKNALDSFSGKSFQIPPQYSAISIQGERAYKKARRGEKIELQARPIEVYELEWLHKQQILKEAEKLFIRVRLKVSKGTYIRAIARDLGEKLGVPAHLSGLRRISCGNYHIFDCSPEPIILFQNCLDRTNRSA